MKKSKPKLFQSANTYQSEVLSYNVSGEELTVVDIPTGYVHSITNVGEEDLVTVMWANEVFDTDKPDTFYEAVLPEEERS